MSRDVKQGFLDHLERARPRKAVSDGWAGAVELTERWLVKRDRADSLLEQLAESASLAPRGGPPPAGDGASQPTEAVAGSQASGSGSNWAHERARAQQLFYGVVRWWSRLEAARQGLMARAPRPRVHAVLLVAGFELLDAATRESVPASTGTAAKVVHYAVERSKQLLSAAEAGFVNAVLRRMAERLKSGGTKLSGDEAGRLAAEFAHPEWLVQRWLAQFGSEATRRLLEWNQQPAPVYARWRRPALPVPDFLKPTPWPTFFEVIPGHWAEVRQLMAEGTLYVQDPATRLCVDLLALQPGETVLDGCAAPGGKSVLMADLLQHGRVVAVERPAASAGAGERLARLKDNLSRAPSGVHVALVLSDLRQVTPAVLKQHKLPAAFKAVLVDVPCTNTGVMRHRVDAKWRLREGDFAKHAAQQYELLRAAARLTAPGGRLVYSTCSLDSEENEAVVQRFTRGAGGAWRLERSVLARPWIDGCDGAGSFLLRRQ
ncbi:MAG: RsmB/NOP family class I SAM-dependent RNA methyltransferase [Opitutaceae bacterium]|nr:RsmB/NOP family class I SAM-dependent RNA methyltransferase [Opitutaceae bacterium]